MQFPAHSKTAGFRLCAKCFAKDVVGASGSPRFKSGWPHYKANALSVQDKPLVALRYQAICARYQRLRTKYKGVSEIVTYKSNKVKLIEAVATILGTTIGAGVLGLPYVFSRVGVLSGFVLLFILGGLVLLMNLMLVEISSNTKGVHQLVGLAEKYLGKPGKVVMIFNFVVGIWGAMTAYLIGESEALSQIFGIKNKLIILFLVFFVLSGIVYFGLKLIEELEIPISFSVIGILLVISLLSFRFSNLQNSLVFGTSGLFLAFGAIFFSLLSASAIPEIRIEVSNNRRIFRKAVIIGTIIPILIYAVFALSVVSLSGFNTTQIATIGVGQVLGRTMMILGNILPVLSMAGAYLILGQALKDSFVRDLKIRHTVAFLITVLIPLFIVLFISNSFISVISFIGGLVGGLDALLFALMYKNLYKNKLSLFGWTKVVLVGVLGVVAILSIFF